MGIRVECDWCRRAIEPGEVYVTVQIEGQIIEGCAANEPKDVSGPARVYCGQDRYTDDDPAARGFVIGDNDRSHRTSCASRMLAALEGNPVGRADMGLEWRLVPQVAPRQDCLVDGPITVLGLSGRIRNALDRAGVASVRQLAALTEAQWIAIPGISRYGAQEILMALHRHSDANPKKLAERIEQIESVAS